MLSLADLAFAFGCFHFGFKKSPPPDTTNRIFMAEVEKVLRNVPNVDNVQIEFDQGIYDEILTASDKLSSLSEDGPYPYLMYGEVYFDLLIPLGAQEELLKDITSAPPLTFTERFQVEIHYQYHFPVTVFRLIEPTSEPDPSDAVVIIRELLSRELERQDSFVDFQFLGPSPLHADFYLSTELLDSKAEPWTFDLSVNKRRGYDKYNFHFNESVFADEEEALDALLLDLLSELDLHYFIVWLENRKMHAWANVNELSQSLVDLQQRKGIKGAINKLIRTTPLTNNAFVSLAEFEANSILNENALQNSYRHVYSSDTPPYLREIIDSSMRERYSYPTEQVKSLLQLFETRRLSAVELRIVLISAVSGGVFGALVTAVMGGS